MIPPSSRSEFEDSRNPALVTRRLRLLVGIHVALGVIPAASFLVPLDLRFLPATLAIASVSVGQLMLLSFWAGMGTSKGIQRLFGTLFGVSYTAIWPTVGRLLMPYPDRPAAISSYTALLSEYSAFVLLFAAVFLLVRRWIAELQLVSESAGVLVPTRFQYKLLHVMLIISVVAVVLGLVRYFRMGDTPVPAWRLIIFLVVTFLVNLISAVWAALGAGPIRVRVTLVLLVALLLGIAVSLAMRYDMFFWWMFLTGTPITVLSTAIVLVSLLAVRSCGYRIVPKPTALA